MSRPAPNTSLSLSSRLLCYLGPPSAILLTSIVSPRTGLLSPLAFLPTAWFYKKWRESNTANPSRRGQLEPMIWTYAAVGTLGITSVALIQMGVAKAASGLLFGSGTAMDKDFWTEFARNGVDGLTGKELTHRANLAASWQNWVFNGALTFVAAGLGEETLKYLPIAHARRRGTDQERRQRKRAYIDYALAGALGFGLVENIGFLYVACDSKLEAWPQLLLTIFERVVVGQIGHISMAALTALRAIRRDYYGDSLSWWGVVGPAILYHGAFDFVVMSASALEGNVGWIHPTGVRIVATMFGLCIGMVATSVWQVREEWTGLEERDRLIKSSEEDAAKK